jgi:hypothetical protein
MSVSEVCTAYYIDARLAGIEELKETHWYRKTEVDNLFGKLIPGLRLMATMACEHSPSCDVADIDRGGCCNSCWSRRFAVRMLKRLGEGTGEDTVCPECGVVHLPGQNTLCTR